MSNEHDNLQVPEVLPLLPVRDVVIFPYMILPLFVGRTSSINAVNEALNKDRLMFLASQKDMDEESPTANGIHRVGCVAMIMRMNKLPDDGKIKILVQGLMKAEITEFTQEHPNFMVKIRKLIEPNCDDRSLESEALIRNVKALLEKVISMGKVLSPDILVVLDEISEPGRLADLVASNLGLKVDESQNILETLDPIARLRKVNDVLTREVEVLDMQQRIQSQAKDEMTKSQRDYFLREQMRAIRSELGDSDTKTEEVEELRGKINNSKMTDEAHRESLKQLKRLENMHSDSAEASIIRTYLDWMVELPWSKASEDTLDLKAAKTILDEDHFDLEKVKDRILDHLGVCKLKKSLRGPILCFVGPPGVGKTSLGKSIARTMGRKFVRMSLGGIKDESEIRGHRRTYVGAMPGRIIQSLRTAQANNPVIMLDEIDKLGMDYRGDPASALLEVLDPEQNNSFRDHYINLPVDLSNVMFICTANMLDTIPGPLRDRMEVISLSGYSLEDKLQIARRYLIPKQIKENGLAENDIEISDASLKSIIRGYTREAGLRNLEREIAAVCRKVARSKADTDTPFEAKKVSLKDIGKFLGPVKYLDDPVRDISEVGVATGLAWTSTGGETLTLESALVDGKGSIELTGQLGDVMKESARAALSYVKGRADELGLSKSFFSEHDLHLHFPAAAIPKDGPSAGVTIATTLVSLLTDIPVNRDVAMTGEVTLLGKVLPVGGIKEKILAAIRQDIFSIIMPKANEKDLVDLPKHIRSKIEVTLVQTMDEVLEKALTKKLPNFTGPKRMRRKHSTAISSTVQ
ncbi:MAG: ATP-dependent proteinase [Bacteriovoracaceae bacterium]|nr:ATP-dependent proteinase [Bacteriovoracaceae bacterium]